MCGEESQIFADTIYRLKFDEIIPLLYAAWDNSDTK